MNLQRVNSRAGYAENCHIRPFGAPKKILVANGAGFVGASLCEKLLHQGHRILCLDDFSAGTFSTIAGWMQNPELELAEYNSLDSDGLEVDQIYDLRPVAPVRAPRPERANSAARLDLPALARRNSAGILKICSLDEPCRHAGTMTDAADGFAPGEAPRLVRIFDVYGPGMPVDGADLIGSFISCCLKGEDIVLRGDAQEKRSFCYIDDLVDGLQRAMNGPDLAGSPIDLGNPAEFYLRELARMVIAITGARSHIQYLPQIQPAAARPRPDIAPAARLLDWVPRTDLMTGLTKTVAYFETILLDGGNIAPGP